MIVTYVVPNLAETIHSERANLDKSVTDQQRALVSFLLNEADSYLNDAYTFNRNEAQQTSVGLLLKNLDAVKATITSYFEDKKQIESSWQALKDLTLRSIAETKTAISNRHKQHVNDAKQSAILFSLAMLSFGFFAWIITHTVSKRLRALSQVAKRAGSAKDLSILSNDASEDEIGVVALSFNELISTLRTILHNIKHSGSLVSNSSAEIAAVSRQQQATTAQIAATTTQIEATSKHIAATSGELAANMRNIQHITEQTSSRATDGQENLEKNAGHRPWNYHSS
jgi:methyl-accepting chemotaxis protein WspA